MSKKTTLPLPSIERLLKGLGQNIKLARLRRRLTAEQVAQRSGMSRPTLRSIEQGSANVTLGAYANVLHVLGLEDDLAHVAQDDILGRKLQDANLLVGQRVKGSKRK